MPILAESWESLIAFVVIMAISGIASWLKQRKGGPPQPWGDEEEGDTPPLRRTGPPPQPAEPEPVFDLERELRRMLGQEPEAQPPPPPVAQPDTPAPVPPLVVVSPASSRSGMPPRPGSGPPVLGPRSDRDLDALDAPTFELAPMTESAAARARAGAVDDAALARIEAARQRTEHALGTAARPDARRMSPEVAALLASLRQPATARQAVLAAVVLGPPKALERSPG